MSNTLAPKQPHTVAPQRSSFVADAAGAVSSAYALVVAVLASVMRPRQESPAEAAARLRTLAEQYRDQQPSFAADLLAAADATSR